MHYGRTNLRTVTKWLPVIMMYAIDWDQMIKFILNVFFKFSGLKMQKNKVILRVSVASF